MNVFEILVLPNALQENVSLQGETAMGGFQTGEVHLKDGRKFFAVIELFRYIYYVQGFAKVPFGPDDIEAIRVTHKVPAMAEYDKRSREIVDLGYFADGVYPQESVPVDDDCMR